MARAGDTPDFSTLEARVRETQGEVKRLFLALMGGDCEDDYSARAALPLNRIGPVGRPMGEPPSGSSVISNS